MKNKLGVAYCGIVFALCLSAIRCFGTSGEPQDLHLIVAVPKNVLLPYEPISLQITLTNTSASNAQPVPGRWSSMINVEFTEGAAIHWKRIPTWWRPSQSLPPLPPITLGPGEGVSTVVLLYAFLPDESPLLKPKTAYWLRASLSCSNPALGLTSNKVTINVDETPAAERVANHVLVTNKKLLYCLLPERIVLDKDPSAVGEMEAFIEEFPQSVYSRYFRAAYVALPTVNGIDERSKERISKYRDVVAEKDPWLLSHGRGNDR
jgi:hypothetical protein